MSQSFYWANAGKREWIDCDPFDDGGFMLNIASYLGNRYTDAASTLLAGPWHGDPVMFIGDYFNPVEGSALAGLFDGYPMDDIFDNFKNVGGIFRCAEGKLRPPWEDGDDPDGDDVPYEGAFNTEICHFRYALDRTRGEYVDRDAGPVRCVCFYGGAYSWHRLDPLVALLMPRTSPSEWDGRWCCDQVEMLDEMPPGEYRDVARGACGEWPGPLIFATDGEMAKLTSSAEFARLREERGIATGPGGDVLLRGAIEALLDIAPRYGKGDEVLA